MSAVDPGAAAPETAPESAPESAPTTTETQPTQTDGLDRVFERMDAMSRQQAELLESFQQLTQPPEEEPDYYDEQTGALTEEGAQAYLRELVREGVEAELGPREAQRLIAQRDEAYEALQEEYEDLQNPQIAERVLSRAIAWAQAHNPDVIERPEFVDVVEWVYTQEKFQELRAQHAAEQPRSVVLESASGARQQTTKEEDWGERIVKAAERLRPQI